MASRKPPPLVKINQSAGGAEVAVDTDVATLLGEAVACEPLVEGVFDANPPIILLSAGSTVPSIQTVSSSVSPRPPITARPMAPARCRAACVVRRPAPPATPVSRRGDR